MKTYLEQIFEECDNVETLASAYDGHGKIQERMDKLWNEIKAGQNKNRMREKAIKVAAITIRFINDVC